MGETTYGGMVDWHRRGPHARVVEAIRAPAGAPVSLLRTRQPPGAYPDPPLPEFSLGVGAGAGAPRTRWDVGTGSGRSRFAPGRMVLAPAATACDYEVLDPLQLLVLNVPLTDAVRLLGPARPGGFAGDFGRLHGPAFADPFISALCRRIWEAAAGEDPPARLFLDGAVLALLAALLRLSESAPATEPGSAAEDGGGLASWRLRRALDMIGDRLGEDLSLDELASAAGLSPVYFARQFRRATGLAPHRYLSRERVRRAGELLAGTELPVAEVALACGFCDQAHLTRAFRAAMGTTPAAHRRAARGR